MFIFIYTSSFVNWREYRGNYFFVIPLQTGLCKLNNKMIDFFFLIPIQIALYSLFFSSSSKTLTRQYYTYRKILTYVHIYICFFICKLKRMTAKLFICDSNTNFTLSYLLRLQVEEDDEIILMWLQYELHFTVYFFLRDRKLLQSHMFNFSYSKIFICVHIYICFFFHL